VEGAWAARARGLFRALAIAMALFSLFLVARMFALGALCPWCLLSAALSFALGAIAVLDGASACRLPHSSLAGAGLAGAMVARTILPGARGPHAPPRGEPEAARLARPLTPSEGGRPAAGARG